MSLVDICNHKKLSIDVSKIIVEEIVKCVSKRVGRRFFSQLITMLCLEAGVPFDEKEEKLGGKKSDGIYRQPQEKPQQ